MTGFRLPHRTARLLTFAITLLLMAGAIDHATSHAQSAETDLLAYTYFDSEERQNVLVLYEPALDMHTVLYVGVAGFDFSVDGRIAFSVCEEGTCGQMRILDTRTPDFAIFDLSDQIDMTGSPLAWSRDGRYLAFSASGDNDGPVLYVWDSETDAVTDVTPNAPPVNFFSVVWSPDGRLAITAWFGFLQTDAPSEIYLWDGTATVNLSQNPGGSDSSPAWSADSEFAFQSFRDEEYSVRVWDGVSVVDGLPDVDSFTDIAAGLIGFNSSPIWTPGGDIAFTATLGDDATQQIYLWDGTGIINISQNPESGNSTPAWSGDGRLAFYGGSIIVRDESDRTILDTEQSGIYPLAWSADGHLAFCRLDDGLLMWDGTEIVTVQSDWDIWAQWQLSGQSTICSNG